VRGVSVLGFTGTRRGMTLPQHDEVLRQMLGSWTLHHGDCIGADAQAHVAAQALSLEVVLHPPSENGQRAFCPASVARTPLPYLERNHAIVDECDYLIAAPGEKTERARGSGTWATIRYARKTGVPVTVVFPDGSVE
jgi:hypothetical protein